MYITIGYIFASLFFIVGISLLFYKKSKTLRNYFKDTFLEQGLDLLHNINRYNKYNNFEIVFGITIYIITTFLLSFVVIFFYPLLLIIILLLYFVNKRIKQRKQF